jgi:hypothetical protein
VLVWWNCLFTGWSFGNAKNRQRFHEKLLSGFGRWQSRCQITNPSIQPQARKELYEYSGVIWTQRFMSFVAFGLVTQLYIWPRLRILERDDALIPLVVPHTVWFIGLSFLVPGVVSPSLPSALAAPAAYGDLVAAILAFAATVALSRRWSFAISLVWLFNVWGATDLLFAFLPMAVRGPVKPQRPRSRVLYSNGGSASPTYHAWPDTLASSST